MVPSSMRNRPVDCMEELAKYTIVMQLHLDLFGDRYSEGRNGGGSLLGTK